MASLGVSSSKYVRHCPNRRQETHNSRPTNRPFCCVLKLSPDSVSVIRLWLIDSSDREPDDENDDDDDVAHGANFVDPTDELCALHGDKPLHYEKRKEC